MPTYDDSESRKWVIDNFPFDYLPNNTVEIVNRAYNDVIDLQGVDVEGNTTILIEVQVREQWGDLPYKDWTSKRYKDRSWGLTVEQRKWKGRNGRPGHFQLDQHIPLIYVVLNNTLNRCVFATRESILSGRTVNRFAGRYWGNEDFKHTNDYTEFEL